MSDDLNDILNVEPPPPDPATAPRRSPPSPPAGAAPRPTPKFTAEGYIAKTGEYEFGIAEGPKFSELASVMRFVGTLTLIFGVLGILGGMIQGMDANEFTWDPIGSIIQGVLFIIVGAWTRSAATHFELVATTEGNDITHLMSAVRYMHKIYGLQAWVISIALALMAVVIIFLIM